MQLSPESFNASLVPILWPIRLSSTSHHSLRNDKDMKETQRLT